MANSWTAVERAVLLSGRGGGGTCQSQGGVSLSDFNVRPSTRGDQGFEGACTSERGVEPDDGGLTTEGVVPTGLAAVVILVAVPHGHLVGSGEGQAVSLGPGAPPAAWLRWTAHTRPELALSPCCVASSSSP